MSATTGRLAVLAAAISVGTVVTVTGTQVPAVSAPAGCERGFSGGAGDDRRTGDRRANHMCGRAGNDQLHGRGGADLIDGGTGDDFAMVGGPGADVVVGRDGHDTLVGGGGRDQLEGGEGWDFHHGGRGDDALYGGPGWDELDGGDGADYLAPGPDGDPPPVGGAGDDVIFLSDGLSESADCGPGFDTLYVDDLDYWGPDCEQVVHAAPVGRSRPPGALSS